MLLRFFTFLLIASATFLTNAQQTLVFSTLPGGPHVDLSVKIMKEVYSRIGYSIRVIRYPADKALQMSSSGQVDGELRGLKDHNEEYPSLLKVPTPYDRLKLYAFTVDHVFEVDGAESFKPYSVGVLKGARLSGKLALYAETVYQERHWDKLFSLLALGEVDIVISERHIGLREMTRLSSTPIRMLRPELASVYVYHFLHKKHEALVPLVANEIEKMNRDGEIAEMTKEFYLGLFKQ